MPIARDITNQRFGQLVGVSYAGKNRHGHTMWRCRCDCGQEVVVGYSNLMSGNSKTCESCRKRKLPKHRITHGKSRMKAYAVWVNMRHRCQCPHNRVFKHYGGRGIAVCERWMDFENFLADMGECPPGYSIERIDVNGHYEPTNCEWIPMRDQRKNQRRP